jgi:diguanylate cyclase (GGDEF)-like protein
LAELKIDSIDDLRATHGQIAAEAVLMQCGVRLATIIRGCDMLGRLDGERFGLILPRTSLQHGIIAVERIRAILAATSLGLPDSDERVQVSLSIGIAALQETIPERKHLQQLAHRRLERALQAGRGQLVAEAS